MGTKREGEGKKCDIPKRTKEREFNEEEES